MNNKELVKKAFEVANEYKTVYANGMFGQPITNNIIEQKARQLPKWYTKERQEYLYSLVGQGYFGFDCVCFIKAILFWGWNGDASDVNGGAKYNGSTDYSEEQLLNKCTEVSDDFSNIEVGEYLYMRGHCGIYIGNGKAAECTPKWKNGVQITAVHNIGKINGLNGRYWEKHGKLPNVEYLQEINKQQYKTNEIVMFKGGKQYNNAYTSVGIERKAGLAKITKYYDEEGSKHHYHLIGEKNGSNVYGWVDEENIEPIKEEDLVVKKDLIDVDGIWGKDTTLKTQKVFKTVVDGIISKQNVNSKQYLQNASETSWQFVESNKATGSNLIKAIQRLVGADVDGKCGRGTIKAMQNFLNRNGFSVGNADGYMGEKTVKGWQNYINSRL